MHSDSYFPNEVILSRQKWYGSNLEAMGEPSLFALANSYTSVVIRGLWVRSFRNSICITLRRNDQGESSVNLKILKLNAEEEPDHLIRDESFTIEQSEFERIQNLLEQMNFWQISINEKWPMGHHGERWIFEVLENKRYHIVDRYAPNGIERDRLILELGEALLKLAGMDISDIRSRED